MIVILAAYLVMFLALGFVVMNAVQEWDENARADHARKHDSKPCHRTDCTERTYA